MRKIRIAFILNIVIFGLVLLSAIWMISGVQFSGGEKALTAQFLGALKFYTVDSNILMGIIALWMAIVEGKVLKGKIPELPTYCYVLKLVATSGVTLTMLITMFFLAPTFAGNWLELFAESNFFMHLLNPLLSIVVFVIFERNPSTKVRHSLWGISTVVIYAFFYVVNVLENLVDGQVQQQEDWYGFFVMGTESIYIVLPIILLISYLISLSLWTLNKKKIKSR